MSLASDSDDRLSRFCILGETTGGRHEESRAEKSSKNKISGFHQGHGSFLGWCFLRIRFCGLIVKVLRQSLVGKDKLG
jgi:hypothetical protein